MNELSTKNDVELLEAVKNLNIAAEWSYHNLALGLYEVSERKLYLAAGYESYAEYVSQELGRSKTFASNMLLEGEFIKQNNLNPNEIDTSYARLVQSIRSNKGQEPAYILAAATTLSESELISKKQEEKAGEHECLAICKHCKRLMGNGEITRSMVQV